MSPRGLLAAAAVLGFTGVALGAFGAHALSSWFAARPDRLPLWQTAVLYHLIHAVAAVLAALVAQTLPARRAVPAGACFLCGIVLFSGSLYLLAVEAVPRAVAMVTPIGGLLFLAGWLLLALSSRPWSKT